MITTKEILAYMETGNPFSIQVVAYDRNRKKGGQIKDYPEAKLVQNKAPVATRPATPIEKQKAELAQGKKDPHHRKWFTRNIQLLQNGYPIGLPLKIHPPLIIAFNGDNEVVP